MQKGQNPNQDPYYNLPNAAATYAIGGMSTHWTACTPKEYARGERPERSDLLTEKEWNCLYMEAEHLLNTHSNVFDSSIRQKAILNALLPQFPDIVPLPLGVEKVKNESMFLVKWTGADTVLGEDNIQLLNAKDSRFSMKVRNKYDGNDLPWLYLVLLTEIKIDQFQFQFQFQFQLTEIIHFSFSYSFSCQK